MMMATWRGRRATFRRARTACSSGVNRSTLMGRGDGKDFLFSIDRSTGGFMQQTAQCFAPSKHCGLRWREGAECVHPGPPRGMEQTEELCQAAIPAGSHIAHLVQEKGALHSVELGSVGGQFREERVGEDGLGFFLAPAAAIAQQVTDIDFECVGKPLERGEGGASLGILNLGDVGAGNLHSSRELTLAEATAAADVANSAGNLRHSVIFWSLVAGDNQLRCLNWHFFHLKWFVAPAAE